MNQLETLSLDHVLGWFGILSAGVIVPAVWITIRRPRWVWPVVIVGNILAVGPKTWGYFLLDELLMVGVVIGVLLRSVILRSHPYRSSRDTAPAFIWFRVWMMYLMAESIVGIVVNEDIRILRFFFFFLILLLFVDVVGRHAVQYPFPRSPLLAKLLVGAGIAYLLSYLIQGVYWEFALGAGGRFTSQEFFWSGSAAAVFPIILVLPACFGLLAGKLQLKVTASVAVVVVALTAVYFDSRITFVMLVIFGLVGIGTIGVRRRVSATVLIITLALLGWVDREAFSGLAEDVRAAASSIWTGEGQDAASRRLQLIAGVNTLAENPAIALSGSGLYSHRFEIVPHVRALLEGYSLSENSSTVVRSGQRMELMRTVGLTALLVDTGLLGILLMLVVIGSTFRHLRSSKDRTTLRVILVLAVAWLGVSNILDMALFFLICAPGGILWHWSEHGIKSFSLSPSRRGEQSADFLDSFSRRTAGG